MMTKRGRPKIKPVVKRTIYSHALKDKNTPRQALAVELRHLIEEIGEIAPSEETMIKMISQFRNNPKSPIDEQWSLGSLSEYPIPIDTLPLVISIVERRLMQNDPDGYLTIREAIWVARSYKLIELYKPKSIPPDVEDTLRDYYIQERKRPESWPISEISPYITIEALVDDWASVYAGYEQLSEEEGETFDSSEFDVHLTGVVYEYWGERRGEDITDIVYDYNLKYPEDYFKLLTFDLPLSEIEEIVKSREFNNWPNIRKDN